MTDKTNNKNLEEEKKEKDRLVQLEKSPSKIPTLGHPSSGGMMCQQRKAEDIGDPLKHFQQLLIHTHKKCLNEILFFLFQALHWLSSATTVEFQERSTPQVSFNLQRRVTDISSISSPTSKYVSCSRCSFFVHLSVGFFNYNLSLCTYIFISGSSRGWQFQEMRNSIGFFPNMQTHLYLLNGRLVPTFSLPFLGELCLHIIIITLSGECTALEHYLERSVSGLVIRIRRDPRACKLLIAQSVWIDWFEVTQQHSSSVAAFHFFFYIRVGRVIIICYGIPR